MIAYFDADGRTVAVGDMGPPPGTEYTAEVPNGTDPNSIYFMDGEVINRLPFPITVGAGQIDGLPDGTTARIAGGDTITVTTGSLTVQGWVRLEHPHYLDWAGNVPASS